MKYHVYVEDSVVSYLAELEGPLSDSVLHAGFLEEKTIEADNIEMAVQMARQWAESWRSDVPDSITVIVEQLSDGQHRHFEVFVTSD